VPVEDGAARSPHLISIVVPVYRGEQTLPALLADSAPLTEPFRTPAGHPARVAEVILVHDHGPDGSAAVIRRLAAAHEFVRPVWLSRNFGQHAATLAGMASSGGDWVATLDEDGQHDPAAIGAMLDVALSEQASVVYGRATNEPPHGFVRNTASRGAKWVVGRLVAGGSSRLFNSYRFMLGEVARGVGAYAGAGVYLDVALGWIAGDVTTCPVMLRAEGREGSGYTMRSLASHFWRMVLTSGTRLLRMVSVLGVLFAAVGVIVAIILGIARLTGPAVVQGWTSVMVVVLLATGAILFALGIVAEYLGVAVNMAMGKPLYLITSDPLDGPLGRGSEPESP
jgi:undecaprenyl-phosphate 4-deoxy-4-formamido-L-arabinose transferase